MHIYARYAWRDLCYVFRFHSNGLCAAINSFHGCIRVPEDQQSGNCFLANLLWKLWPNKQITNLCSLIADMFAPFASSFGSHFTVDSCMSNLTSMLISFYGAECCWCINYTSTSLSHSITHRALNSCSRTHRTDNRQQTQFSCELHFPSIPQCDFYHILSKQEEFVFSIKHSRIHVKGNSREIKMH